MFIGWEHVNDDSNPERSERTAPPAQGTRGVRRHVVIRLPSGGDSPRGRTADATGASNAASKPVYRSIILVAGRSGTRRARQSLIVLDASAVLEVLLRSPTAATVEERIFDSEQTLHAPHLIDVEVTQVLRHNLTIYDAVYVALAEALEASLLTCDQAPKSRSSEPDTDQSALRDFCGSESCIVKQNEAIYATGVPEYINTNNKLRHSCRSHNPLVAGSSPAGPTIDFSMSPEFHPQTGGQNRQGRLDRNISCPRTAGEAHRARRTVAGLSGQRRLGAALCLPRQARSR